MRWFKTSWELNSEEAALLLHALHLVREGQRQGLWLEMIIYWKQTGTQEEMPSSCNSINNQREDDLQTKMYSPPSLSSTWPTRQKPSRQLILQLCSDTCSLPDKDMMVGALCSWYSPPMSPRQWKQWRKSPLHRDCPAPLGSAPFSCAQLRSVSAALSQQLGRNGQQWERDRDVTLVLATFLRKRGNKRMH